MESRTIRVPENKIIFLLRGKLISRDMIKPHTDKLELPNIVLRLAKRIFSFTDIDVKVGDEWVHVPCCNSKILEKLYEPVTKQITVENIAPVKSIDPPHEDLVSSEIPQEVSSEKITPEMDTKIEQESIALDFVEKIEKPKFKKRH
nr:MAG TPA: hypothetical protein [Caudoviricetes sp.]